MTMKARKRHRKGSSKYVIETNRARRDSIRWVVDFLERHGFIVDRVAQLTTILVERPATMSWATFKAAIRSVLQRRKGSAVISSCRTGRVFLCDNRGNQPGVFQRLA